MCAVLSYSNFIESVRTRRESDRTLLDGSFGWRCRYPRLPEERDLIRATRAGFFCSSDNRVSIACNVWVGCEIAIAACDLAEVIGSAIALNLLFGIPLIWGVCLTACDVLAVLYLQNKGFRLIEDLVSTTLPCSMCRSEFLVRR
jgi:hypothetical protein